MQRFDDDSGVFGRVEGLVLASDFGYSGDFGNNLVFAINDITSKNVLVYREERDGLSKKTFRKKELTPQRISSFGRGQEKFPFESLNPLKSADYTWSLVNISPDEVYSALRDIGFNW